MSSGATPQLLKVYMAQSPDSDGVEEFQLRKQTQYDRLWFWLTRRSLPTVGSWQHYLLRLFDSPIFSIVVVIMTILALFLVDCSVLATNSPSADAAIADVIFVCFVFFLLEILGSILVQDDYFLSFFFLCDFIGTLSLIFDIPWLSNPIGLNFSTSSAAVLRASRIARTGTRATRVLRLLRTMRMPAILRCCKGSDTDLENDEIEPAIDQQDEAYKLKKQQQALAAQQIVNTNVGSKLQLVVSKRVIFLVTIMIFVIPLLTENDVDRSKPFGLTLIENSVLANPLSFNSAADLYENNSAIGGNCIFISILGQARPSVEPDTSQIRPEALLNVTSDSKLSYALFDNTSQLHSSTLLSLGMTIFTIVLFAGGSILFTQDAERLFFKPIERMIKTIKRLANIMFEMDAASDEIALDETLLIEAVVSRVADIFAVKLERDGIKRKTTYMKTISSRWRIHIEEEEIVPIELNQPVKNKDLLLIHEIEELASLPRCLESTTCTFYFNQFLKHEYCIENTLFLNEVRAYRLAAEKLSYQARQIFGLFISDEAVNQVAVDWGIRRAVSQNLKTQMMYLSDLFDSVEKEILEKLSKDYFPRFLNSIYCLKLLKHLTLERQSQKKRDQLQQQLVSAATVTATNTVSLTHPTEHHVHGVELVGIEESRFQHGLKETELNEIKKALDKQA